MKLYSIILSILLSSILTNSSRLVSVKLTENNDRILELSNAEIAICNYQRMAKIEAFTLTPDELENTPGYSMSYIIKDFHKIPIKDVQVLEKFAYSPRYGHEVPLTKVWKILVEKNNEALTHGEDIEKDLTVVYFSYLISTKLLDSSNGFKLRLTKHHKEQTGSSKDGHNYLCISRMYTEEEIDEKNNFIDVLNFMKINIIKEKEAKALTAYNFINDLYTLDEETASYVSPDVEQTDENIIKEIMKEVWRYDFISEERYRRLKSMDPLVSRIELMENLLDKKLKFESILSLKREETNKVIPLDVDINKENEKVYEWIDELRKELQSDQDEKLFMRGETPTDDAFDKRKDEYSNPEELSQDFEVSVRNGDREQREFINENVEKVETVVGNDDQSIGVRQYTNQDGSRVATSVPLLKKVEEDIEDEAIGRTKENEDMKVLSGSEITDVREETTITAELVKPAKSNYLTIEKARLHIDGQSFIINDLYINSTAEDKHYEVKYTLKDTDQVPPILRSAFANPGSTSQLINYTSPYINSSLSYNNKILNLQMWRLIGGEIKEMNIKVTNSAEGHKLINGELIIYSYIITEKESIVATARVILNQLLDFDTSDNIFKSLKHRAKSWTPGDFVLPHPGYVNKRIQTLFKECYSKGIIQTTILHKDISMNSELNEQLRFLITSVMGYKEKHESDLSVAYEHIIYTYAQQSKLVEKKTAVIILDLQTQTIEQLNRMRRLAAKDKLAYEEFAEGKKWNQRTPLNRSYSAAASSPRIRSPVSQVYLRPGDGHPRHSNRTTRNKANATNSLSNIPVIKVDEDRSSIDGHNKVVSSTLNRKVVRAVSMKPLGHDSRGNFASSGHAAVPSLLLPKVLVGREID
jgi:hypothetical protein